VKKRDEKIREIKKDVSLVRVLYPGTQPSPVRLVRVVLVGNQPTGPLRLAFAARTSRGQAGHFSSVKRGNLAEYCVNSDQCEAV
jgi:hypothetical protein